MLGTAITTGFKQADSKGWSLGSFFDISSQWPALEAKLVAQPFNYMQNQISFAGPDANHWSKLTASIGKKELGFFLSRFQAELLGTAPSYDGTTPYNFGVFDITAQRNGWASITGILSLINSF